MQTRNQRNLIAVGLMTLVAIGFFVWGMYYLLGTPMLRSGMDLLVQLDDGAGVRRGDRVQLQGVDIGSVSEIHLVPPVVEIKLRLQSGLLLPKDSRASIKGDVFGAHFVEIVPGSSFVQLQHRDTISGAATPQLTTLAAELGGRVQSVLGRADTLLSDRALADLHATVAIMPAGASELLLALTEFRLAAVALRRTAEDVQEARTGESVSRAIGEVEASARSINAAAGEMERSMTALASMLTKVDGGQGTLGRLINDESLYVNLNDVLREVGALATDIRERPRRYLELRIF
jgi:phospholipid/cholesterol/gamma-HCH transport system substrate-binding protein